jgi:hypothetical protein
MVVTDQQAARQARDQRPGAHPRRYPRLRLPPPAHAPGFLHLPSLQLAPLLVSFGIWEAAGDPAEQLRILTRADDPAFMQPPAVEEFGTGNLGPGLKVLGYSRDKDVVTGHLAYAWRSEELATALRMFTGSPDLSRLQHALPDIENLARAIAWVPLAPDTAPPETDGCGWLGRTRSANAMSSFLPGRGRQAQNQYVERTVAPPARAR